MSKKALIQWAIEVVPTNCGDKIDALIQANPKHHLRRLTSAIELIAF